MKRNSLLSIAAILLAVVFGVALGVYGAERREGDTAAIKRLIAEFNTAGSVNNLDRVTALFTKTGTYQSGESAPQSVAEAIRQLPPKRLPWDERTPLAIKIQSVRLTGPDTAEARAIQSDYSPMLGTTRKWECTFVLARTGKDWKIAAYTESLAEARPAQLSANR
ncbi:MAG: SgcJ/EcaC family oxidoreductase [Bryobacteraceae bacterium]